MTKQIGVGIIGANPDRGWAAMAHLPAIATLPDFRVAAVSTTSMESAGRTAARFPNCAAFDDPVGLAKHPEVDLVAVTVKVPDHFRLAMIAIDAGKHVLCEWPLGLDTAEAERLQSAAQERGVHAFVGLQGRLSPTVAYLRELLATGYIGDLLSCSIIGSGLAWGAAIDQANAYLLDARNGATMLSIPVGHLLDTIGSLLGPMRDVKSEIGQRRRETLVMESGAVLPLQSPDQILIAARFGADVPVSIHYRGGLSRASNLHWELNGTKGDLIVSAPTGHVQMSPLALHGVQDGSDQGLVPMAIPSSFIDAGEEGLAADAASVRRLYKAIGERLAGRESAAADFGAAVRCHRMLDAITAAAELQGVACSEGTQKS